VNTRSFLSLFFVVLAVALAGAVGWRVHAYNQGEVRATINGPAALDSAPAGMRERGNGGTAQQQQIVTDGGTASVAGHGMSAIPAAATQQQSRGPMTLREQRFAEALAAAQRASAEQPQKIAMQRPAPAPAIVTPQKPAEKPGILARIGNAISNAFNGNSTANAAPQQQNNPSQRRENPREKEPAERDKPKEKDPASDTMPPQLQGIVFQPPVINDGQETSIIITAVDDLSGIRNISGSVASPTGKALQGFAAQREAPESSRYIARISVPKDAEQGMWHINFLSLTDNASNTTNINMQQTGGAGFTVNSSRPDSTPPSLRAVYVDRRAMNGGEKNTVFVQATDDKSGVAIVSGVFQSPAKTARIGFGCRNTAPDQFECDLVPPKSVDCGEWQLEQIQLQDKAQNMTTVRGDNPLVAAVKVNIGGDHCDSVAPTVESLTIDPLDVSNANDGMVTVTAIVSDDSSGVASISGQVAGPAADNGQPPRVYFAFQPSDTPDRWIGRINIPKFAAKGTWTIVWLQALDKSNNLKTYAQTDPVLANAKFTVH